MKGNDMVLAILTLHYCRTHNLLFLPSLQEWLSFTPVQIDHTFGEVLRLTDSACPRCLPVTQVGPSSVLLEASDC
jgi:hypothetical protein